MQARQGVKKEQMYSATEPGTPMGSGFELLIDINSYGERFNLTPLLLILKLLCYQKSESVMIDPRVNRVVKNPEPS